MENNVSRIYQLYENNLHVATWGQICEYYYGSLHGMWEELNMYQPITSDIEQLKKQHEEF